MLTVFTCGGSKMIYIELLDCKSNCSELDIMLWLCPRTIQFLGDVYASIVKILGYENPEPTVLVLYSGCLT